MHRPKAWTRVRGRGYRMDPDEKWSLVGGSVHTPVSHGVKTGIH